MELFVGHLLGFIVRKKILFKLTYLIGTLVFLVFSCRRSVPPEALPRRSRIDFLTSACGHHRDLSPSSLSSLIVHSEMLNHLGFVLRPHSFFYCSVPKVATRTILTFLTYLHIRDELIPSQNSSVSSSTLFKARDLSRLLPPSNRVTSQDTVSRVRKEFFARLDCVTPLDIAELLVQSERGERFFGGSLVDLSEAGLAIASTSFSV